MFRKRTAKERFWEMLPGLQFWSVFFGAILLAYFRPVWAALFIICFDLYWVLKAVNVSLHLIASYRKFRVMVKFDWLDLLARLQDLSSLTGYLGQRSKTETKAVAKRYFREEQKRIERLAQTFSGKDYRNLWHLVILPFVDESFEVLDSSFQALSTVNYPTDKMIVLLAAEARAGQPAQDVASAIRDRYSSNFYRFYIVTHPDGLPDEIKGKSANASYAVKSVMPELENLGIGIDQVIVSNFDSDTIVHPEYFARVSYEFLTSDNPYRESFQPISLYNNNIWDSPAFIRVVSVSNSFWQFTESSRPNRLRTFSSHSMSLRALIEVGFWKKDIINEDGYIFWQCYLHYNGDYRVVPLFIPIYLDTCLADTFWETLKNQYKQKRRWAYNVEYYPHLIPRLIRSRAPFWSKFYKLFQYVESNFNWATASILISSLGWLPLFLGGTQFGDSVLAFNLPKATRILMTIATVFLIFSVYINLVLLPPRPKKYGPSRSVMMYLQWFLVPFVSVVFGSLPAIEAQTRLMLGRYLEFWVTPKTRRGETTSLPGLGQRKFAAPAKILENDPLKFP